MVANLIIGNHRYGNKEGNMNIRGPSDRRAEWFVPSFGPERFRLFIGLLFLPYTAMVVSYSVIGSMLAQQIHWDRVVAIMAIFFLALGIGGHTLDALGSKGEKPWGTIFPKRTLMVLSFVSIAGAYAIGIYYMLLYTPLLWLVAIPEGFFLFAYNLEWFNRKYHTDGWFAFSWGSLPVLAGYILQTNRLSLAVLLMAAAMGLLSLVEIKVSRPYKQLKRQGDPTSDSVEAGQMQRWESILKSLSLGIILLGAGMVAWRLRGV